MRKALILLCFLALSLNCFAAEEIKESDIVKVYFTNNTSIKGEVIALRTYYIVIQLENGEFKVYNFTDIKEIKEIK